MDLLAFIMGRGAMDGDTGFLFDPGEIVGVGLLYAAASVAMVWLRLRSRRRHDEPFLTPTMGYLAATTAGLFLTTVLLILLDE